MNNPGYLDRALGTVGHYLSFASGAAGYDVAATEVDQDRPLCVRIGWAGGGGHFLVIRGYDCDPGAAVEDLEIDDPFYGPVTLDYSAFQSAYQGTGAWTHSFFTQP